MDRTKIVIQFKQIIWTCPSCGQEDIVDANMDGGNVYEHDCSVCQTHFNGPVGRPGRLDYTGTVSLTPEEHTESNIESIKTRKCEIVNKWMDGIKNPPKAIEPTAADLEKEHEDLIRRAEELLPRIKAAPDYKPPEPEVVKARRDKLVADLDALDKEIEQRTELPVYIEDVDAEAERLGAKKDRVQAVADKIRGNQ